MGFIKHNHEHFDGIKPFDFSVSYVEIDSSSPENEYDSHIHEECEIYINLSGDVSFVVENRIYPIVPGSIIITRPFEYHHCVYHSNKLHKHFWILFSSAGNEELLDVFYKRNPGDGNLLMLSPKDTEALTLLCHKMTEKEEQSSKKYYRFMQLINLLQNADAVTSSERNYPDDIIYAINYIGSNLAEPISVVDIAKGANVSVNTLERHFLQILNSTPSAYIRKKRLANAAKLLSEGFTVTEASENSGFSDYSNFIALFKKTYGMTPLKYKKNQIK